jgi:hypothetical protein
VHAVTVCVRFQVGYFCEKKSDERKRCTVGTRSNPHAQSDVDRSEREE